MINFLTIGIFVNINTLGSNPNIYEKNTTNYDNSYNCLNFDYFSYCL